MFVCMYVYVCMYVHMSTVDLASAVPPAVSCHELFGAITHGMCVYVYVCVYVCTFEHCRFGFGSTPVCVLPRIV
jgi:hypothetical protein